MIKIESERISASDVATEVTVKGSGNDITLEIASILRVFEKKCPLELAAAVAFQCDDLRKEK